MWPVHAGTNPHTSKKLQKNPKTKEKHSLYPLATKEVEAEHNHQPEIISKESRSTINAFREVEVVQIIKPSISKYKNHIITIKYTI